jgi:hypothetical protein
VLSRRVEGRLTFGGARAASVRVKRGVGVSERVIQDLSAFVEEGSGLRGRRWQV